MDIRIVPSGLILQIRKIRYLGSLSDKCHETITCMSIRTYCTVNCVPFVGRMVPHLRWKLPLNATQTVRRISDKLGQTEGRQGVGLGRKGDKHIASK